MYKSIIDACDHKIWLKNNTDTKGRDLHFAIKQLSVEEESSLERSKWISKKMKRMLIVDAE